MPFTHFVEFDKMSFARSPDMLLSSSRGLRAGLKQYRVWFGFVRDFKMLKEKYRITKLAALDLFPHTAHVELVVLLEKIIS